MPLKQFTIDFQELGKEKSFRYDVDFVNFQNEFLAERFYSFNDLFTFSSENKVDVEKLDDNFFYSEIGNVSKEGDVEPVKLNFNNRKEEEENYYKKIEKGDIIKAKENEILISKVRPNLKKYVFVDKDNKSYFYTSAFIHLVPKKLNKILYYSLRTIFYPNLIAISRQGKGYPTLKADDFLYLKFDKKVIDKLLAKQDQIIARIEPIERNVKKLKNKIIPAREIINKVFAREFGFDLEKFEELKKENFFETDFSEIDNDPLLIFKVKYHKYNLNFLDKVKTVRLKEISSLIKSGNAEKYEEVAEEGNYISVEDLSADGNIISCKFTNSKVGILRIRDVIFSRVGSKLDSLEIPIGIIKNNFQSFASDNILIIRLNQFNNDYVMYFLKSIFGNKQIRKIVKTKGQPVINSTSLGNIKIPNISLKSQQKIVDEIKTELDKQEKMNLKIETERNKIDGIIEKAIS